MMFVGEKGRRKPNWYQLNPFSLKSYSLLLKQGSDTDSEWDGVRVAAAH